MASLFISLPLVLVVLGLMTLGGVLLIKFIRPSLNGSARIGLAAIVPPLAIFAPAFLFSLLDGLGDDTLETFLALLAGASFMALIVGWPVAHFATKRLDRLTQFDLETFE